jgi:predicted ATPase/DNA-binding winged helix-turn-helix (wHTH) protein
MTVLGFDRSRATHLSKASSSETPAIIEFARFRLLPLRRELLADSRPVHLGGRAFDVLMALIEGQGAVVGKDALIDRVWPNRIVEESSLQVQISALRNAFGADRNLIRTISGRGYQFTGEIRTVAASPHAQAVAGTAVPVSAPRRPPTNLPEPVSELIGRDVEFEEVLGLTVAHRLVTLTGAGGIGKTRLGLEVARRLLPQFADGICVIELAPLTDSDLVPVTVAAALGLDIAAGTVSHERVAYALGSKQLIIVLDNCEHVVDAATQMAEALLRANPGTRVIATSRERLRADGEWVYPVPPLGLPTEDSPDNEDVLRFGAVRLFVERARAVSPHFSPDAHVGSVIAGICRRLDGIPLAIELGASRAATLGIEELAARLDHRFELLTGGRRTALPRQRTLRATLDWSYELLPESQRVVLRRLAIFSGGFGLEAAEAITATAESGAPNVVDSLADLVAKSLVARDVGSVPVRYWLLDTMRAYAREKLTESGELEITRRRHAEYFRDLFEQVKPEQTMRPTAEWIAAYGQGINDVRAALDWAFLPGGDPTVGVALTIASDPLWFGLSLMDEWRTRVETALASLHRGAGGSTHREMQLLAALGAATLFTTRPTSKAGAPWTDVLDIAEGLDDTEYRLRALSGLWAYAVGNADLRAAVAFAQRIANLAPNHAGPTDRLVGQRLLGTSLYYLGDQSNARRHLEDMLSRYAAATSQPHINIIRFHYDQMVAGRGTLARILWLQGFPDQAMRMAQDDVEDARAIDHLATLCIALDFACMVVLEAGDLATTGRYVAMQLDGSAKVSLGLYHAFGRWFEGALLIKEGDAAEGLRCLRAALDELCEIGFLLKRPGLLCVLAEGLAGIGQVAEGLQTIDDALAQCERTDERWNISELLRVKGEILLLKGAPEASAAAEDHYRQGLDWARRQGALSWELRVATSLARLLREQNRCAEAIALLVPIYNRFTEGFETDDLKAAKALIDGFYNSKGTSQSPLMDAPPKARRSSS